MMAMRESNSMHTLSRSFTTMPTCVQLLRPGSISPCQFPRRRDYPVALLTKRTLRQQSAEILTARRNAPGRVSLSRPSGPTWRPRG
jgi:hypothetical protein